MTPMDMRTKPSGMGSLPTFHVDLEALFKNQTSLGTLKDPPAEKRGVHPGHRKQVTLHLHLRGKNIRTYSFIFKYSHGFLHFCVFLFLEKNTSEKNPQQSQQKSPPSSTWK
jgi:hypothetical protein